MFYILIISGMFFIAFGTILEKKHGKLKKDLFIDEIYNEKSRESKIYNDKREVELLEKRLEMLEEMLFTKVLNEEINNSTTIEEDIQEKLSVEEDSMEKYKLIVKYEKQKKSLDEIAKLLGINKGEVLLLKNLYKNL